MTTDADHAAALRRLLYFTPSMEGDSTNIAIERAIEALDEVERLRTALWGDTDEYVILKPEDFKTLVTDRAAARAEVDAWRALAERLIAGFGRDDPPDYHATTTEYERLRGES